MTSDDVPNQEETNSHLHLITSLLIETEEPTDLSIYDFMNIHFQSKRGRASGCYRTHEVAARQLPSAA